ncbi:MAG: hypothetical protein IJY88_04090, partial [Clostridia bacterium]|nr:hypothetical protein [Clostridia bacterium]
MKKFLAVLLTALLVVSAFAISAVADTVNWEDGQTRVENEDGSFGNYTFDNAYEFVFRIDNVNGTIAGEDNTIITSAAEYDAANPNWAISVLLAPTSDANVYEVALAPVVTPGNAQGGYDKGINFENGNIVLIAHSSGSLPEATNDKGELKQFPNWQQKVAAMALKVGDKITLAGVDLAAGTATDATATVQAAPEGYVVTNGVPSEPEESEPEESEPVAPAEPKMFWVTHVADNTVEGSGVIFTEAYEGAGWWIHVAFAPVADAEGVFEITAISDGTPDGHGVAQAIPEGGFVWASNYGNDYSANNGIDYTSPNCTAAIADAQTWTVGMQFTFDGIDPLNPVVPESEVAWYDDAYVCNFTYTVYTGEQAPEESNPEESNPEESEPAEDIEAELKDFVGEAVDGKFDLVIDAPETYKAGDEITVTVTVANITAENGLHVVKFNFYYDSEKLVLTN